MPTRPPKREKANSQFPKPRFFRVRDSPTGQNAYKFFEYWTQIPLEMADLIEVKVYRTFPVVNFQLVDPNRKTIYWDILSGPCLFSIENYEQEFLDKYGSGGWKLLLNEKGVSGPVMECLFRAVDQDAYPCKIDVRTLVKGAFGNEEYVQWAQRNNVALPWDGQGGEEGGEDMSGVTEALKSVLDHSQRVNDKNLEMVEEVAEAKIEAIRSQQPAEPNEDEHATRESIRLVADSAREAIKLVKDTTGKQYDAVEIITAVGGLLQKGATTNGDQGTGTDRFIEITKLLLDTQSKGYEGQLSAMRDTVDSIKAIVLAGGGRAENGIAPGAVVPSPPKTFVEQMKEAKEIADMFNGFGGGDGRDREDEPPRQTEAPRAPEKSLAMMLAENLPALGMILMAGANILYNMKLKPGEAPQNPAEALKQAPGAGQVPGGPAPAGSAGGATQGDPRAMWMKFIQDMRPAFLGHFFSTESLPVGRDRNYKASGYTLAYFLCTDGTGARITDNGRRTYMAVRDQLGPKGFDQLIRQDFEIWSKVGGMQSQYARFMGEFFTYDTWLEQQADGEPETEETPKPAAA